MRTFHMQVRLAKLAKAHLKPFCDEDDFKTVLFMYIKNRLHTNIY